MRISDWSSDVCSSDLSGRRLSREVPEQLSSLSGNQLATGMNASCAADLILSPGPGKGTHFHPLATRVNDRFDPTPPSPASDIGPILPKVPSHPAPHETAETAGSPPANHPVPSASPPPPLQPLASGHAVSRPALRHPSRSAPT